MTWRIYRLPGSREIWHIDSGQNTQVFNVRGFKCHADTDSVDIGGNNVPRAWIEVFADDLHIINGVAEFTGPLCGRSNVVTEKSESCASPLA